MPERALAGRRIALVLASSTGGVGNHVRSLVPALREIGATVAVHGPAATGELFDFTAAGATFHAVEIATSVRPRADVSAVRRLRRGITGADVVHAHGLRAGLVAVLATRGLRRRTARPPVVVTLHNAVVDPPGVRRLLAEVAAAVVCRRAAVVLGASADLVDWARARGAGQAWLGPVDAPPLPAPTRATATVRAELGAAQGPLVLAVGRLHPQKGYDVLLSAAARWSARLPPPVVAIAGDGPLAADLATQVAALAAPVRFLGRRTDVADLLAAADLVVLPSRWEARSLVAQEALRAGVPLVATAVGGTPELVGVAAVLVPAGDVDALDTAVTALLDDAPRRAELARLGPVQAATWPTAQAAFGIVVAAYTRAWGDA